MQKIKKKTFRNIFWTGTGQGCKKSPPHGRAFGYIGLMILLVDDYLCHFLCPVAHMFNGSHSVKERKAGGRTA